MDQSTPLTKRELKQLRRLEKLGREKQEGSRNTIRWIMLGVGAFLFVAFFGSLIFLAKQSSQKPVALSDNGWERTERSEGARLQGQSPKTGVGDGAKVTLTEFGDFQCPACKTYYPMIQGLLGTYKDRSFRLMFKHFPLTSAHKNAFPAAMAAEAAGTQGKFFEMHDILYDRQDEWALLPVIEAQEKFISYAAELKLDQEKFLKGLTNKEFEEKIRENQDEGINNGVSGTPTFFLNGKIIQNPRSVDDFKKIIDQEFTK